MRAATVFMLICAFPSQGTTLPDVVLRENIGKSLIVLDPATQSRRPLYQTSMLQVSDVKIRDDGSLIGAIETIDRQTLRNRLIILDPGGAVRSRVERNVRAYSWCCAAEQVAIVTGDYKEGTDVGFRGTGAYVVDLRSGIELPVRLPGVPVDVVWAAFDSSLYFKLSVAVEGDIVFRYDPRRRAAFNTPYRDIAFSPSGEYYLFFDIEDAVRPGWHIVERATGRDVPLPDSALGRIGRWVGTEGATLYLERRSPMRVPPRGERPIPIGGANGGEVIGVTLYDVRNRREVMRADGRPLPAIATRANLPLLVQNDRPRLIQVPRQ